MKLSRKERIKRVLDYHKKIEEIWAEAKKLDEEEHTDGAHVVQFIRKMVCTDVYFLLYYVLERKDMLYQEWEEGSLIAGTDAKHGDGDEYYISDKGKKIWRYYRPFLWERCKEVQAHPDGYLDIWARDHYKSTIITYAMTIQEILKNPEITICIYSYNVSTAKKMLTQIKNDLQSNNTLLTCFPDILFSNTNAKTWFEEEDVKHLRPHKLEWSDDGFTVKRKTNPKEHTVECSGLVTGQKTGGHYQLLIYDDTVTPESVFTANQIKKTTEQFKMSINTGSTAHMRIRMIGTRYALGDTYEEILKEHIVKLRRYPCYDEDGAPALYPKEEIDAKLSKMHGAVAATQMFCDPQANNVFQFEMSWIPPRVARNTVVLDDYNWYIICDPAYKVSEDADYTVFWVVGCGYNNKYLVADLIRDKLTLTEKQKKLFKLVKQYTNSRGTPTVFYERVSMQSDIQHFEGKMDEEKQRFTILEASGKPKLRYGTTGGSNIKYKDLRIQALQPLLKEGKISFIESAIHTNWKGESEDMLDTWFKEEYAYYPNSKNDDGLDGLSRMADLETGVMMIFPIKREKMARKRYGEYDPLEDHYDYDVYKIG